MSALSGLSAEPAGTQSAVLSYSIAPIVMSYRIIVALLGSHMNDRCPTFGRHLLCESGHKPHLKSDVVLAGEGRLSCRLGGTSEYRRVRITSADKAGVTLE